MQETEENTPPVVFVEEEETKDDGKALPVHPLSKKRQYSDVHASKSFHSLKR